VSKNTRPGASIKSKKDFDELYTLGKTIYSSDGRWKSVFLVKEKTSNSNLMFAAAVHKKSGTAVWRNRIKRLLKESYRIKKNILADTIIKNNLFIKVVFSPNLINQREYKNISLEDTLPGITDILNKIKNRVKPKTGNNILGQ